MADINFNDAKNIRSSVDVPTPSAGISIPANNLMKNTSKGISYYPSGRTSLEQTLTPFGIKTSAKVPMDGAHIHSSFGGGTGFTTRAYQTPAIQTSSIVDSVIPQDSKQLHALYRSIHKNDVTVAQATELLSNIPFGKFGLTGCDPEILKVYNDCLEVLNLEDHLPKFCCDYLVFGKICLHFLFDKTLGIWKEVIAHDPDFLEVTPIPLANFNPMVSLMPNSEMQSFGVNVLTNPRFARFKKFFDMKLISSIARGISIELPESNTAYLARKLTCQDYEGTSIYSRIIALVLYEYALLNGNIDVVNRRIGPIKMVSIPSSESNGTIPTWEELDGICNSLIQADRDPINAYVAVQRQVQIEPIPVGEHIPLSNDWDLIQNGKLRALGLSDEFLSGTVTFGSMEAAFSMFAERVRALRAFFEQKLLYEKVFEPIARVHQFYKRTEAELAHNIRSNGWAKGHIPTSLQSGYRNSSSLDLPTVTWFNGLTPNADSQYLELLEKAISMGLPISPRFLATAFGLKFDDLISAAEADKLDYEALAEYNKTIGDAKTNAGFGGGGEDEFGEVEGGTGLSFSLKSSPENLDNYYQNLQYHSYYKDGVFLGSAPADIAKVYLSLKNKDLLNDQNSIEGVCNQENVSPAVFKYALKELNVINYPLSLDESTEVWCKIMETNPPHGQDYWTQLNKLKSYVSKTQPSKFQTDKNRMEKNLNKMRGSKASPLTKQLTNTIINNLPTYGKANSNLFVGNQ